MKFSTIAVVLGLPLILSGCLYGQCMNGACPLERARYLASIKAYGEFFVKPGMTTEGWRRDWVACGGWDDGQYGAGPRLPGETGDLKAAHRTAEKLEACMNAKGYFDQRKGNAPVNVEN
uniref:Lipoprotein n=1 Tax=Candidatus Kentrum sp. LPFa TaxID=2126335 RepID=A0A450VPJ3_9GAMM|nr:MAG: hypothetical protein BECKLPF1236B_GA0070989_100213 [Candidatus Kentron sp. LPFa]